MGASQVSQILKLWKELFAVLREHTDKQTFNRYLLNCVNRKLNTDRHNQWLYVVNRCRSGTAPKDLHLKSRRTNHCHATRGHGRGFTPIRPLQWSGQIGFSNRASLVQNALQPALREIPIMAKFRAKFVCEVYKQMTEASLRGSLLKTTDDFSLTMLSTLHLIYFILVIPFVGFF